MGFFTALKILNRLLAGKIRTLMVLLCSELKTEDGFDAKNISMLIDVTI